MTEQDDLAQQEFLKVLLEHQAKVYRSTLISAVLYGVFVVISIIVAFDQRPWQDPLTLASIGLFIAAMAIIPRDYVPPLFDRKAVSEESIEILDRCRNLQRLGIYQRMAYLAVALVTIGLLPWLINRYYAI